MPTYKSNSFIKTIWLLKFERLRTDVTQKTSNFYLTNIIFVSSIYDQLSIENVTYESLMNYKDFKVSLWRHGN